MLFVYCTKLLSSFFPPLYFSCLRNRTTLRFDFLHKPRLFHTEKFQDSQQRMRINTKPNGGKNEVGTEKNDIFVD